MNSIHIYNSKKLARKHNDVYLAVATIKEIKDWNLQFSTYGRSHDSVHIYTEDLTVIKENGNKYDLIIKNGYILTALPNIEPEDELPIIISMNSKFSLVVNSILQIDSFKNFIELKSDKISNNSTKVMTINMVEKLVAYTFDSFTIDELYHLMNGFCQYIDNVISRFEFFKYYSVKHIKEFKGTSIIHSPFSWFIIFKYFTENCRSNVYKVANLPKLDLDVQVGNWNGNFFDKKNPMWYEVYKEKRRFYPTKENLEVTYKLWMEQF